MKNFLFLFFLLISLFGSLYAQVLVAPFSVKPPLCDGIIDSSDCWNTTWIPLDKIKDSSTSHNDYFAQFQMMHNADYIFIAVKVQDATVGGSHVNTFDNDCSELYFSMDTTTLENGAYFDGCWQLRAQRVKKEARVLGYLDGYSSQYKFNIDSLAKSDGFEFGTTDNGKEYTQEFILPKTALVSGANFDDKYIRFDIEVSDNDGNYRTGQRFWNSNTDLQWSNTKFLGIVKLEHIQIELSALEVEENAPANTVIGTLSLSGDDVPAVFTLNSTDSLNDNSHFAIVNNQLVTNGGFDYESKKNYLIEVTGVDENNITYTRKFEIKVTNRPEIQLSSYSVNENEEVGALVGNVLDIFDGVLDSAYTYSIVQDENTDYNSFYVDKNSLRTNEKFNFEIKKKYSILLQRDSTIIDAINFEINDTNDPPTDVLLSNSLVSVGSGKQTLIGILSSVDEDVDETFTYSLSPDDGDFYNDKFAIDGNKLHFSADFDFINATYQVRIQTEDHAGMTFSKSFTIQVTTVNNAPTNIKLSKSVIDENMPVGSFVGRLSSIDANLDDSHTYSLVTGDLDTNNESFKIQGDSLVSNTVFDFEKQSVYSVRIQTNDRGGKIFSKAFLISINNLDEVSVDFLREIEQLLKVYPNPVNNGNMNVELLADEDIQLDVINVLGETLVQTKLNVGKNMINIGLLSKGIYVLNFKKANGVSFQQKISKL